MLAVNTAGMLVRRSVLEELGGFDEQLAVFGNDIDFGWRAAAAGHQTIVVPAAVVFHVEAAHRGVRRTPLTGRHTHYQERRAALYTLLANARARALPWQVVRLCFGTLLRVLGFLLVRSVGQALRRAGRPGLALRQPRSDPRRPAGAEAAARPAHEHDVRGLLAPWWLPYRHGLDVVSDLVDRADPPGPGRRRAPAGGRRGGRGGPPGHASAGRRPSTRTTAPAADTGLVARFLTNPVALGSGGVRAAGAVRRARGDRSRQRRRPLGRARPTPATSGGCRPSRGTRWARAPPCPAPPYVLPLAMLATLLGGSVSAAVSAILLLAVPVALWGAWRFLRVVGRLSDAAGAPRWLLAVASCTYALVPVVSGAWGDGRLGIVVVTAALPWLGHAALGFADPEPDRRWRAAWRSGLLLGLVAAFTPVAWFFAAALVVAMVGVGFVIAPATMRDRSVWGPPVTMLRGRAGAARAVVAARDRPRRRRAACCSTPAGCPTPNLGFDELLAGRLPGDLGAPWWLGLALVVMAVLALIPSRTRIPVLVVWIVALVAARDGGRAGAPCVLDLPVGEARPGLGLLPRRPAGGVRGRGLHRDPRPGHPRPPDRHRPLRRLVPVALTAVVASIPLLGPRRGSSSRGRVS